MTQNRYLLYLLIQQLFPSSHESLMSLKTLAHCVLPSIHSFTTIYSYKAFVLLFFSFIGLLLSHQNLLRLIQYFCTTLYPLTLKGFLTTLFSWLNVSLSCFYLGSFIVARISHHVHDLHFFVLIYLFAIQLSICQFTLLAQFEQTFFSIFCKKDVATLSKRVQSSFIFSQCKIFHVSPAMIRERHALKQQ